MDANEKKVEARDRLSAMLEDDGGTWDLSPNDKTAISTALGMMETDLAIDQICGNLPDGYQVVLTMEAGSATIEVTAPTGCCVADEFVSETFAGKLKEAYDAALEPESV